MTTPPYSDGGPCIHVPKAIILAEAQNWRCCYCPAIMVPMPKRGDPKPNTLTVEHVKAKGAGGKPVWENEVAACFACNTARGHYSADLFWLLMQAYRFDRRMASIHLRTIKGKARDKLRHRLNLTLATHGLAWLQTYGVHAHDAPSPQAAA